jgi:hypothetical protein
MTAVWQSAQLLRSKLAQPSLWPAIIYICSYIGTTVIGAVAVLTPFGQEQAKIFLPDFAPERMQTFGSPLYLALLFGPLLVVPAFVLVGLRAGNALLGGFPQLKVADPSTRVLYGLMAIFAGWCLYKLAATNYLVPDVMLDQTKTCTDRIIRRVKLLAQLHYTFYAFAYAALPFVSVMFLVKGIQDRKAADLAGFVVSFVVIFYLYAAIYMKAPFAIYFLILLIGLLAVGLLWWKAFVAIGCLASVTLVASHIALGCTGYGEVSLPTPPVSASPAPSLPSPPVSASPAPALPTPPVSAEPPPALPSPPPSAASAPALPTPPVSASPAPVLPTPPVSAEPPPALPSPQPPNLQLSTRARVIPLVRNLVFRMALSFPYYMETFKDPTERCGIEDDRIPLIPKQACFPASKVFSAMYPRGAQIAALSRTRPNWLIPKYVEAHVQEAEIKIQADKIKLQYMLLMNGVWVTPNADYVVLYDIKVAQGSMRIGVLDAVADKWIITKPLIEETGTLAFRSPSNQAQVVVSGDNATPAATSATIFGISIANLTYVQGQAPASAHISAMAEIGPWFAFLVMIATGLAIGITSQLARLCGPALSIGVIAAVSVFAYNLTQVPFVGAFTYSQGLIAFLFPVALIIAGHRVLPSFSTNAIGPMGR